MIYLVTHPSWKYILFTIHSNIVSEAENGNEPSVVPMVVFKERWKEKEQRIRSKSVVGHLPGVI